MKSTRVLKTLAATGAAIIMAVGLTTTVARAQAGNDTAELIDTGDGSSGPDCFGEGGPASAAVLGFVNAHRLDDQLVINVHVKGAAPNKTYFVGLRCIGVDAVLKTNKNGVGNVTFTRSAFVTAADCSACGYGGVGTPITQFSVSAGTGSTAPGENLTSRALNP